MAIRVVRLGSPRAPGEGTRLGTVRRHRGLLGGLLEDAGAVIREG